MKQSVHEVAFLNLTERVLSMSKEELNRREAEYRKQVDAKAQAAFRFPRRWRLEIGFRSFLDSFAINSSYIKRLPTTGTPPKFSNCVIVYRPDTTPLQRLAVQHGKRDLK
jgi:hypothetical protein